MNKDYQDIFMKLSEKARKKGGSMAAVFKLIQELLDFEEKIQECINAQEMSENQNKIEAFMGDIDRLYDVLFEIARGGISSIRNDRRAGIDPSEDGGVEGEEETVDIDVDVEPEPEAKTEISDRRKTPVMLNVPQIPKM